LNSKTSTDMIKYLLLFLPILWAGLSSCERQATSTVTATESQPLAIKVQNPQVTTLITRSPRIISTPEQKPTSINHPTSIPATPTTAFHVCSPLDDIPIQSLMEQIVNPFNPPYPGSDNPHQGVDLAVLSEINRIALSGSPVQSALDGKVVLVIRDRFPYGNAILIETPLNQIPTKLLAQIQLPTPAPTLPPHPSLTCPESENPPRWDTASRSLYSLYAHMAETPNFTPGDPIVCGQQIGNIGNSGNALNPHLHLEMRVGPANAVFPGMAHYDTRAKAEEMQSYCIWRVSGLFQLVNPMVLFIDEDVR